ncbi:adenosylcobinamide amidohydrolase [Streptomyces sp. G2]|uniref:adenosylcobinamide amidohydrolase n=2 Tax=Streptomyces TaxID=1883 RepID=UPI00202E238E|nr:adenosylcobinamide amidohydrolase [Streptomyces sp. G2]MCM1949567.1 adenosylcobinamide amidohydrolase [Streptomyces sp. G2]
MTAVVEPTSPALPEPPELRERDEDGQRLGALLWRPGPGWRAVSSAVLGGGIGERAWVMNAQVAHGYTRTDPEAHLAALARRAGLDGPGVGLMTAAEVARHGAARDGGVDAVATAGIDVRGWAAAPGGGVPGPQAPGTINIVVTVPAPLTDAALVNAVATATEAKVQALLDAGLDCSGTPTDAVCVLARTPRPGGPVEPFAGPRSLWGARLARAVHRAVGDALR